MSYTITLHLNTTETMKLVESSVWHYANGGTWEISPSGSNTYVLTMSGSGTSGMLRFQLSSGELFAIAAGVHNYAPWSGVAVDLAPGNTLQVVHKEFYAGGSRSSPTVKNSSATSKLGQQVSVVYDKEDGRAYDALINVVLNPLGG